MKIHRSIVLALTAMAAASFVVAAVSSTTQPATTAPASQPTTYPAGELVYQSRKTAEALQDRLDGAFKILIRPPFVIAGNLSADRLRAIAAGTVIRPAEALWAGYFRHRPDKPITVLLLSDARAYRMWADRLFGDRDVSYFGYYRPAERTLVMDISTGGGTLIHELTHALIAFDWPAVPLWFNEGLATLGEQCRVEPGRIVGLPNWRLDALQNAIREGKLRPLADLVTRADFLGLDRGLNYAQARYFCMYLQSRGLLKAFYRQYRQAHAAGESTAAVIEKACGQPIAQVDQRMRDYVMTLTAP